MPGSEQVVEEDLSHRFDMELGWKGALEGKALSYLGFVGVSVTILFAVLADRPEDRGPNADLIAVPVLLLVVSIIPLMVAFFGYGIRAGPAPLQVFQVRTERPKILYTGLARAYAETLLWNRIGFTKARFSFQLAVLVSAGGMTQLAISLLAASSDPERTNWAAWGWLTWLPGILIAAGSAVWLFYRDAPVRTKTMEDLITWQREARDDYHGRT